MIFAEDYALIDSLEREVGETEGIERAKNLYELAGLYFRTKQYLESIRTFEQAAELFEELGERVEASEARRMAALVMAEVGWVDEAIPLLKQVIEDFRQEGDELGIARSKSLLGDILLYQAERPEDALKNVREAREIFLAAGIEDRAGLCSLQIGFALKYRGDLNQALAELEVAQALLGKSGISFYQAQALDNMGDLHFELESYEEAIRWYTEAEVAYEASGYANGIGCDIQIEEAQKRLNLAPNTR